MQSTIQTLHTLALSPADANTWHTLGIAEFNAQNSADAIRLIRRSLTTNPGSLSGWNNLGYLLNQVGRSDRASLACRTAVCLSPDQFGCFENYGLALLHQGQFQAAIKCFYRCAAINPKYISIWILLSGTLTQRGFFSESIESAHKALMLDSMTNADAWMNHGIGLRGAQRTDAALDSYRKALCISPGHASAWSSLGNLLIDMGMPDKAICFYQRALTIEPNFPQAWSNLGGVQSDLRMNTEALASFDKAIELNPDYPQAHMNLGLHLIRNGEISRGWHEYEWRWMTPAFLARQRHFKQLMWTGERAQSGGTLLIYVEQGFGDTIQFSRYMPLIQALGWNIVLEIQPALVSFLSHNFTGVRIIARGQALGDFDTHISILSLPRVFKTSLNDIPQFSNSLKPTEKALQYWNRRFSKSDRLRIGVTWSGNSAHANDRNRSIPFEVFTEIFHKNLDWVVLQKDIRDRDRPILRKLPQVRDFSADLNDFDDTAALCGQCDLVITVDTSVVHLAGAMGKPTWLLLPYAPDFRWFWDRPDTPWYPSVRIFRQRRPRDWSEVLDRVVLELQSLKKAT